MSESATAARPRAALVTVLVASFLFNLGQGALRPTLPLYLERAFAANYRMVTMIPVVFGAGKWLANLPTGYLLGRIGRKPLMVAGLLVMAAIDVASAAAPSYYAFLALRGLGGVGWAMFSTVAITTVVGHQGQRRRGRTISALMLSESAGILIGSSVGGLLYGGLGATAPFFFEAACLACAVLAVGGQSATAASRPPAADPPPASGRLGRVLSVRGVVVVSLASGVLVAIQSGLLVFLFPLYLFKQAGLAPAAVGFLVGASALGRIGALWIGGSLSDRWGRIRVMVPGLAGYGVLLACLPAISGALPLAAWSIGAGAAAGLVAGIPAAVIGDRVPSELHGVAMGWLRTMADGGLIVGPLVFGAVADATSLSAPFLIATVLLVGLAWCTARRVTDVAPRELQASS